MMRLFGNDGGRLKRLDGGAEQALDAVWVDLLEPTAEEDAAIEAVLGIAVPTREEMEEIEISSRLYSEGGAVFMTAILPANSEADDVVMQPVSFILSSRHLVTVRYHQPRPFETLPARAERLPMGCDSAEGVLLALLEVIVDRLADILERTGREIDGISRRIFRPEKGSSVKAAELQSIIEMIGRKGDLTSNIRDSLVTLERLIGFLSQLTLQQKSSKETRERIKTLARDVRSLADHDSFLGQKIGFLLEATLGLINIEQNAIIKIFSVAAVVFLPPTLIASIYGMNFEHMPELSWRLGYPMAVVMMIMSAILPYVWFKRRGWL